MKTIFGALALCGMAFALAGNAAGQERPIMGKWKQTGEFCEGGESLMKPTKIQMVINKTSMTKITDFSKAFEINNCSLHVMTNYSIINDQLTQGRLSQ